MTVDLALECPLERRPSTPFWSENFALVFFDPAARVSCLYSIGTWYHDQSVWRENLALVLPDGNVVTARNFGRNTSGRTVSASLSRYEILEAGRCVRLSFDGPVWSNAFADLVSGRATSGKTRRLALDVSFEAVTPMWDMHEGHNTDVTGIAGAMHIEQLGVCTGSLRVDTESLDIRSASSCRDHSRGARDMTMYRNHSWINGAFPSGRRFQLYAFRMQGVEGLALSQAVVVDKGALHPAKIEQVAFCDGLEEHGRPHKVVLSSALGPMDIEIVPAITPLPISVTKPFNPTFGRVAGSQGVIFDEGTRVVSNGETGYGWCERGFSKEPLV